MAVNLRTLEYTIPESFRGETVGAFLRSLGYSRHIIYHLRNTSAIHPETGESIFGMLLNGSKTWAKCILSDGDRLKINILETEISEHVEESCIPLNIIYEDDDLLVINKPAGMPVHPSMEHYKDTLGNALCWYTHHVLGYPQYVNRIINRLDRDTSGLLISAKNMLSAALLGDMVKRREIHREYLAIAEGDVSSLSGCECSGLYVSHRSQDADTIDTNCAYPAGSCFHMTINAPIGRKQGSVIERCIDFKNGEYSVTHLRQLQYRPDKDLSLLSLKLETGRTHQIRVHLNYVGHPLIGDFLYHPEYQDMQRQALHSWRLRFRHPITGRDLTFQSDLPEDMKQLFPSINPMP